MSTFAQYWPLVLALALTGAVAGLIAGLLGVGGGIIIVPVLDFALTQLGISPATSLHLSVATAMATIVPTSIASARTHARRGAIDFAIVRRWSVPILLGSLSGALLASRVSGQALAIVFGAVALLVGIKMLLPLDGLVLRKTLPSGVPGALPPLAIGLLSAMMGIGGGTLSVPTMTLCGEPVHKAVGTAALLGLWISVPATVGYLVSPLPPGEVSPPWTLGQVSLLGFVVIAPTAWLLAPHGARLAHRLNRRHLAMVFGVFLCAVAARMLSRALQG